MKDSLDRMIDGEMPWPSGVVTPKPISNVPALQAHSVDCEGCRLLGHLVKIDNLTAELAALREQLLGGTVGREELVSVISGAVNARKRHGLQFSTTKVLTHAELADAVMPLLVRERVAGAAEQREKDAVLAEGQHWGSAVRELVGNEIAAVIREGNTK